MIASVTVSLLLAPRPGIIVALAIAGLLAFAGAAAIEGRLVFYHDAAAVIAVVCGVVLVWGQPLMPYLNVISTGLMAFLTFGRVGCLLAGCCHGRPARWGVRYGIDHAGPALSHHFVGIRLIPVQAFEALLAVVLATVSTVGLLEAWSGLGAEIVWSAYAAGRFWLESWRGDLDRRRFRGLTEARWTSVAVAWGAAVASQQPVELAIAVALSAATLVIIARRWREPLAAAVMAPEHIAELAAALRLVTRVPARYARIAGAPEGPHLHVARTSEGVTVSAGHVHHKLGVVDHVTFSSDATPLTDAAARALACTLVAVGEVTGNVQIFRRDGIIHVLGARSEAPVSGLSTVQA
jgi:hypothetical protein